MVKVAIEGYLYQDGLRIFDILDRKELEERINGLNSVDIYAQTLEKALDCSLFGDAYTYIDARDGEFVTRWRQQNWRDHPWDSFYEIVLCTIRTPVEGFMGGNFICWGDKKEVEVWERDCVSVEDFLIARYGQQGLEDRINKAIYLCAKDFDFDNDFIKEQLDQLYQKGF